MRCVPYVKYVTCVDVCPAKAVLQFGDPMYRYVNRMQQLVRVECVCVWQVEVLPGARGRTVTLTSA